MSIDWEQTFRNWSKPSSKTESTKAENAERMIRTAINNSQILSAKDISVIPQGSYRNNTNVREDSDVDIAVLFQHQKLPAPIDIIELREKIADQLDKSVDLVCLNTCSPIIGMQIFQHGEVLLSKDTTTYNKYLMRLFTEYHDLKFMRRAAENAILERKYYDR